MDEVFAVEGEGQQAENGPTHQQLKRGVWYQQSPLHARTVLDGCPHILVCQFPTASTSY